MANKRIMKELGDVQTNPPAGCTIKLAKDEDLNVWDVTMDGPADSIYAVSTAPYASVNTDMDSG